MAPHWMLIYPETNHWWKHLIVSPIAGALNAGAAVAEQRHGNAEHCERQGEIVSAERVENVDAPGEDGAFVVW